MPHGGNFEEALSIILFISPEWGFLCKAHSVAPIGANYGYSLYYNLSPEGAACVSWVEFMYLEHPEDYTSRPFGTMKPAARRSRPQSLS